MKRESIPERMGKMTEMCHAFRELTIFQKSEVTRDESREVSRAKSLREVVPCIGDMLVTPGHPPAVHPRI